MLHSFRFEPPALRPGLLPRQRLVAILSGRWQHRVTVLVGGAGLGKTTLLAQALADNRAAPKGDDIWFGVAVDDGNGPALATGVARAVASLDAVAPLDRADWDPVDASAVADALWRRSPRPVCLVLDDVHHLPSGSDGARWLQALIDALPANGHVVLATRHDTLPVRMARLDAHGEVLRLGEEDLRFSPDELTRFAAERGIGVDGLDTTAGWPALAELAALVGRGVQGTYLWQEVLRPLSDEHRRVFAVVCDLGGADDDLVSAVLGHQVDLGRLLEGVPLVERSTDGWHVPHALWQSSGAVGLGRAEQARIRRRAVQRLSERGRIEAAFQLVRRDGLWELAPALLRKAAVGDEGHRHRRLGRWLSTCPRAVRDSAAGRLSAALHLALTSPGHAVEPLRAAARACRAVGDVDAELCAVAQLGRLGWFHQDASILGPEHGRRIAELAAAGHPKAEALAAFGRAVLADLAGDDATILSELAGIATGTLDPDWEVMTSWLYGMVRLGLGEADAVCRLVDRLAPTTHGPAQRAVLDALRLRAWWALGRIDDVLAEVPASLDTVRASGVTSSRHLAFTNSSILYAYVGDIPAARRCLEEGTAAAPSQARPGQQVRLALATAALQLAQGDEPAASRTLAEAVDAHGLDHGVDRRGWRHLLALSYVLVPGTRSHWDQVDLRGYQRTTRELAASVVALRAGDDRHAADLPVPDIGLVRSVLPFPFATELAVGLSRVGRPEGADLLEALGPAGRDTARALATGTSALARPAKALLAALPAPPPQALRLEVLGPLTLRRGTPPDARPGEDDHPGDDATPPDLRRKRIHALLAYLVLHRNTTRALASAALWPDLGEGPSGNNLAVTLNHLLRALEPSRQPGEAAYLVRLDGQRIRLVTGPYLRIDVDDFDERLAAARQAELDGTLSLALDHLLAAVALYRGDLHTELPDVDWLTLHRERYRTRFTAAAIRAAQLLLGRGEPADAEHIARRVLDTDPWAEAAHDVLVSAALARGDRPGARRRLRRCLDALREIGLQPSPTTHQLQRLVEAR